MKPRYAVLLCMVLALFIPHLQAWGTFSSHVVTVGTGSPTDMTGATVLRRGTPGSRTNGFTSSPISIGFTFNFDGTDYSQVIVYTSGAMTLGTTPMTSPTSNRINTLGSPAVIAPFWDNMYQNGGIGGCGSPEMSYQTIGAAPNRIFVARWKDHELVPFYGGVFGTWEVRLYEGSNMIQFYYDRMLTCDGCRGFGCPSTSASIGLATSTTNWLSLSPATNWVPSTTVANNSTNNVATPIQPTTLVTITPCQLEVVGRTGPGNGGTAALANGDPFFQGYVEQMGTVNTYRPFEIRFSSITCNGSYSMAISGAAAADYYFGTPGTTNYTRSLNGGVRDTAKITFAPTTTGVRTATLTVTGPGGFTRTFNMSITVPLVNYIGHVADGGTVRMAANDTLLWGKTVWRHTSQDFQPFSLQNMSLTTQNVSYSINDPSGQYSIVGPATVNASQIITPTLTFAPTGFGPQPARLTVTVGNESRSFLLLGISAAPGGSLFAQLTTGKQQLDTNTVLFNTTYGCVGDQPNGIPIEVVNTGYGDFLIEGVDIYRTDTAYGQGVPRYPFLRDAQGRLIPSNDYILTEQPAIAPISANQVNYPIVVAEGETRTLYLTFISSLPEKRFARIYIRTNGESSVGLDTSGMVVEGMVNFDVFGRGVGSRLSDNVKGGLPRAVTFPQTYLDTTSTMTLNLYNSGVCTLRIGLTEMLIDRGDVEEFEIVQRPDNIIDPVTNDLLIPPGEKDELVVRFAPKQVGSRRASVRLVTNDSTIQIPGITERGTYYIDLYGNGRADLYANNIEFGQALIGGAAVEHRHDVVRVSNTRPSPVIITDIKIEGPDAGEFSQHSTKAWPALPFVQNVGTDLELGVTFAPVAGGSPGDRNATLKVTTIDGDEIIARLHGIAGTRTVMVNPSSVNFGALTVGKRTRQTIAISNSGTMTLRLEQPVLSPGSDFTIGRLDRLTLDSGQVEYLEITYAPSATGASNATLTFNNNSTGGPAVVNLSGAGLKTKLVEADPSGTMQRDGNDDPVVGITGNGFENPSVSGVDREEMVNGMALMQSVPNPARDLVEIRYRLATAAEMELVLYDAQGRMVRVLEAGNREAGEGVVRVNVIDLPSGVYHYRLISEGRSMSRVLRIVR